MRSFLLFGFAIFLDFLQAMLTLAIIAMQALPFVGQAATPFAAVFDVVLSVTFGGALIVALAFGGMFYPGPIISAFIGESIPLLDIFPGWTLLVWRCLSNKKAEEKAAKEKQQQSTVPATVTTTTQAFDGIRAANDNQPSYAQAA